MGGGIAGSRLAIPVTEAGGLGLIGATNSMRELSNEMMMCHQHFSKSSKYASYPTLPVGIGFLLFLVNVGDVINTLQKSAKPPAIIWLFAAQEPDSISLYTDWTQKLRKEFPLTQIWIQVGGSVDIAVTIVQSAKPDVLVMQGNDAGGHGFEVGASLLALIPETRLRLEQAGIDMPVVAAGGVVEARTAAAALSLGAAGVVMGTRFLAANEITLPHLEYQKRIINATDGATSTVRAKVFDELRGKNSWPVTYDGRALLNKSYKDWRSGATAEEIVQRMRKETEKGINGDLGYGVNSDRAAIWAGSTVGLVTEVMPAANIVHEVRQGIRTVLRETVSRL